MKTLELTTKTHWEILRASPVAVPLTCALDEHIHLYNIVINLYNTVQKPRNYASKLASCIWLFILINNNN